MDGEAPDPGLLATTPMASVVASDSLEPVFRAEVRRTVRTVRQGDAVIEVVVDIGMLFANGAREAIRELELELMEGSPAALYRFAESIQADIPLLLGAEAKSDRGWRMLTGRPRAAEKAIEPALRPDISGAEAFRRLSGATLASLLANQPAAAAGGVEGVHGMRIAIRRMRALLALFRPHLAPEVEERFTGMLRRLGRVLGEARDWDVFCVQTLPELARTGLDPLVARALLRAAEREREAAHARVGAEFASPALTRTVLGLAAWAEDPAALSGRADGGAMARSLCDLAGPLEKRLRREVRRRGRHIRRRPEEELHDLRKALKKLRYALEFLESLHRHKRLKTYLRHCKDLQERLGALNDAAVAVALAERLALSNEGLGPAVTELRDGAAWRRDAALGGLPAAWRSFKQQSLPKVVAG
ncbi:CHAD domain-containing protein [Roseomonas pecuniae]|uniref:CHAD domain-containing protein n=1 Tax=Muricoccus pecuniae TaxID=693023 RepID=A0A840YGV3_9PROT|nr:CHAD domain-containing protein [Roseomonas pecuniae]